VSSAEPQPFLETIDDEKCRAMVEHLEFVGRRWVGAVLLAGIRGARRFSEYRALVDGISDRLLSLRLKELESEGFIARTVVPTTPVTISYAPTARGRDLIAATQPLATWALADAERPRLRAVSD
jgi:DNA-binding HxlR family transcriptional regulator